MRFAVLFLAVLVCAGAAYLFVSEEPRTGASNAAVYPTAPITLAPADDGPPPIAQDEPEDALDPLTTTGTEDVSQAAAPELQDRVPAKSFTGAKLVNFHGSVLLQPKGQRPYPATRGTVEFSMVHNGQTVVVEAEVNQGRFSVEVPERCRIHADGGRLEEQPVRILDADEPFSLDSSLNYTFVAEPVPILHLRVFEGTQRVPLAGITVRRATNGLTAIMGGVDPEGATPSKTIVVDGASPIELPYLPNKRPVWLHVSADGYATTAQLVKPQEPGELDVVLWPSATLTVRVTGPARSRLKAITIHRHEPNTDGQPPSKRHFATFDINTPGITSDPDATIFSMENIPALPLTIEARGLDKRGRVRLIGTASVELGPDQNGRIELRLEDE